MTERNDKENTNEEMRGKCNTENKERGKGREGTGREGNRNKDKTLKEKKMNAKSNRGILAE